MTNWKIKRDPFYNELFEQYGEDFITQAGFFYDSSIEDYDISKSLDIMCTPLNFIQEKIIGVKKPCILLSTGSFSPIHSGHIEMMTRTKQELEKSDWNVVGGFFAPDHDEYITYKLKNEAIDFHHRMQMILKELSERKLDWITVDPWTGLFQKVAVNFTDIIHHLDLYITRHLGVQIPIIYICGGDNARFANAFLNRGYCAVTSRPGYEIKNMDILRNNERIIFVENDNDNSSTKIRAKNGLNNKNKKAVIRTSTNASEKEKEIYNVIKQRFDRIETVYHETQSDNLSNKEPLINLDPFTIGCKHNLEISRQYDFFGIKQIGFTNRPGSKPLEHQMKTIKKDVNTGFILHDDDIFTGSTMKYAKNILNTNGITVIGQQSYVKSNEDEETIDVRDFFVNDKNGGLVIRCIDGTNKRVPYIYPFVDPFIRSSINNPIEFSIKIWKINMKYFKKTNDVVNVAFCEEQLQILQSTMNT